MCSKPMSQGTHRFQGLEFVAATAFLKIAGILVVLCFPPFSPSNSQYKGFSFLK